jgi:hypothetical protein
MMSGSAGRPAGSPIDAELARAILRAHAAPLYAIASLLINDGDAAAQVVVDVIAVASPDTSIQAGAPAPRRRSLCSRAASIGAASTCSPSATGSRVPRRWSEPTDPQRCWHG